MSLLTNFTDGKVDIPHIAKFKTGNDLPSLVVTSIGQSRNGKSAFLNCLATAITGKEKRYFQSMSMKLSEGRDVTVGMNYVVLTYKTHNIILIDSQGISGIYSDTDPQVLLFAYYISDVIIFNCPKQLDTASLNLLTPISTLVSKMKHVQKLPGLIFRIFDCVDEYDDQLAKKNYELMMTDRHDSVHGVRQTIKELFSKEHLIVWTERPNRSDIQLLDKCKIMQFFKSDLNFAHTCGKIIDYIGKFPPRKVNHQQELIEMAKLINDNLNSQTIEKFDTASNITKDDVRRWIDGDIFDDIKSNIPDELNQKLPITNHTMEIYKLIDDRLQKINEVIKSFIDYFDKAPKSVIDHGVTQLRNRLMTKYDNALVEYKQFANVYICSMVKSSGIRDKIYSSEYYECDQIYQSGQLITHENLTNQFQSIVQLIENLDVHNDIKSNHIQLIKDEEKHVFTQISNIFVDFKEKHGHFKHIKIMHDFTLVEKYLHMLNKSYDEIKQIVLDEITTKYSGQPTEDLIHKFINKLVSVFKPSDKKTIATDVYRFDAEEFKLIRTENRQISIKDLDYFGEFNKAYDKVYNTLNTLHGEFTKKRKANIVKYLEQYHVYKFANCRSTMDGLYDQYAASYNGLKECNQTIPLYLLDTVPMKTGIQDPKIHQMQLFVAENGFPIYRLMSTDEWDTIPKPIIKYIELINNTNNANVSMLVENMWRKWVDIIVQGH